MNQIQIHVFMFVEKYNQTNLYTKFFHKLKEYYETYNANIEICEDHPELIEISKRTRLSSSGTGEPSAYVKIMDTLHRYATNKDLPFVFTRQDVIRDSGVNENLLKSTLRSKPLLRETLDRILISGNSKTKRYCISEKI